MFNTILLELLGYGVANVSSSEDGDRYINSFYLTDASNMLLVVHSATNWLLFYRWPKCATTVRELDDKNRRKSYPSEQSHIHEHFIDNFIEESVNSIASF